MFENDILMTALLPCILKNAISPEIIASELRTDKATAENLIICLIEKNLIFGYNSNKRVNVLISVDNFEKAFSNLEESLKKEIEKEFCFFNENIDIFSGELKREESISRELKEEALALLKEGKVISTAILQKKLKIGFPNACKIIDWLLAQKLIKKTNTYEVIKNEK